MPKKYIYQSKILYLINYVASVGMISRFVVCENVEHSVKLLQILEIVDRIIITSYKHKMKFNFPVRFAILKVTSLMLCKYMLSYKRLTKA